MSSSVKLNKSMEQECIPVGCILPASVAISLACMPSVTHATCHACQLLYMPTPCQICPLPCMPPPHMPPTTHACLFMHTPLLCTPPVAHAPTPPTTYVPLPYLPPMNRYTPVKILPCSKLRLRAVIKPYTLPHLYNRKS